MVKFYDSISDNLRDWVRLSSPSPSPCEMLRLAP